MFRKNCVVTQSTAPHRNKRPTWEAIEGQRMNSPDERPTPAATTPGPTMRQRFEGGSGRSRTTVITGARGKLYQKVQKRFRKGSERFRRFKVQQVHRVQR